MSRSWQSTLVYQQLCSTGILHIIEISQSEWELQQRELTSNAVSSSSSSCTRFFSASVMATRAPASLASYYGGQIVGKLNPCNGQVANTINSQGHIVLIELQQFIHQYINMSQYCKCGEYILQTVSIINFIVY